MTTLLRREDGTIGFSDLKHLATSPKYFKHRMENKIDPTAAMKIGTATHSILLGERPDRPVVVYDGDKRVGNDWKNFVALHARKPETTILTKPEWAKAVAIAEAVSACKDAMSLINGAKLEVPARWTDGGIECSTGGVDMVGGDYLGEFKVTNKVEPFTFCRLATNMLYHAQLAFYDKPFPRENHFIVAAEDKAPFDVVVFRMQPSDIEKGRKACALWLEQLRAHEAADHWPGHAQGVIDFQMPAWAGEDEDEEEDGGEGEAAA